MNRTSEDLRDLIADLDTKLMRASATPNSAAREAEALQRTYTRGLPTLVAVLSVALVLIGLATLAVRPWKDRCTYSAELCQVESLDIDALRTTIPNSELLRRLPNIDALDPGDTLTAGDIFAMDRFADLNIEELISPEEIDLLLQQIE